MKFKKSLLLVIFTWLATASNFALAAMVYDYNLAEVKYETTDSILYTTLMSVTGTVELSTALGINHTFSDSVPLKSYSFFDGQQTLDQTSDGISATFKFATDDTGKITDWEVNLNISTPEAAIKERTIETIFVTGSPDNGDIGLIATATPGLFGSTGSTTDFGSTGTPGVWTAAVPLPATVWLFGSGLVGLFGIAKRKK